MSMYCESIGLTRRWLDVVELLGEVTADIQALEDVPRVLTAALPAEWASFKLMRQVESGEEQAIVTAQCRRDSDGEAEENLNAIEDPGVADEGAEIVRKVDSRYSMVLGLQRCRGWEGTTEEWKEMVETVCETLIRSLRTLLAWREQPELLGGNFTEMTVAQWRVARLLVTDLSEKQLANDLKISPHTLHCYVKAVYRKLGVRNRMGAVQLLNRAARNYRLRMREWRGEPMAMGETQGGWMDCAQ